MRRGVIGDEAATGAPVCRPVSIGGAHRVEGDMGAPAERSLAEVMPGTAPRARVRAAAKAR